MIYWLDSVFFYLRGTLPIFATMYHSRKFSQRQPGNQQLKSVKINTNMLTILTLSTNHNLVSMSKMSTKNNE